MEPPFCRRANAVFESNRIGVLDFKAVTIIDSTQADVTGDLLSPCSALEGDRHRIQGQGQMVRARFSRILTSTRLSAFAQRQSCRPSILLQILASTTSEETLADGKKAFMQGDPSVRDEPLYATPPPGGLPGVPEGALIRLDREVYGLVGGMSVWRSRTVSQLKGEGCEMNIYEPCLFCKFAVREEPAVDGGSIAPGEFVGCVLLEVDDHLMGGPGKAHHESTEGLRQRIKFGKWHWLLQDGPSLSGGRHFTQLSDRSFKVDMTRFIQERLRTTNFITAGAMFGQERASDRG